MRGRILPIFSLFLSTLLLSFAIPDPAPALNFNSAPARFWGFTFKEAPSNVPLLKQNNSPSSISEKKSDWRINFVNVPDDAKLAIQSAVDTWSINFTSKVTVTIDVMWEKEQNSSILGSARPGFYFNAFPGAPDDDLWYPSALANALAGRDLDLQNSEIVLRLNSAILWYTGSDGRPDKQSYDLASVVLHEIGHGLGFLSNAEYDRFFGTGYMFQPTPYDAYVQLPDGRTFLDFCSRSLDLGKAMTGDLYWSGEQGTSANNNIKPKLYSPVSFLEGSSITHLDEKLFRQSSTDALMTPNLEPGESFREIGPIALGMIEDMLRKPPVGLAADRPAKPLNVKALVGDQYALVTFESPNCRRVDKVSAFNITVSPGDVTRSFTSSPARFSGLKNGTSYTFTIRAVNSKGSSEPVTSNSVIPVNGGKGLTIDPQARVTHFASTKWRNLPTLVYADEMSGQLKIASYRSSKWSIARIREGAKIGHISVCTSGAGSKEELHIFYADLEKKDLIHGYQLGTKWKFETVDGNGLSVQDYSEPSRGKTASDVSISSACAVSTNALQVFYRDETQGILLGAVKTDSGWVYEVVDGDRKTAGRTTGDVAFHLKAIAEGKNVYLFYDSILTITASNTPVEGEVRLASRSSIFPEDWRYRTVDGPESGSAVAGFAVALFNSGKNIALSWFSTGGDSLPWPDQVKFTTLSDLGATNSLALPYFGIPQAPLEIDSKGLILGCQQRLCKADLATSVKLANGAIGVGNGAIVTLGKIRFAIVTINGKLTSVRL